jgi:hypothetical protein
VENTLKRANRFLLLAGVSLAATASLVQRRLGDGSAPDASATGMTLKEPGDRLEVLPPMPVTP